MHITLSALISDIYYFLGAPRDKSMEALNYAAKLYAVLEDFGSQPQDNVDLIASTIAELLEVKLELQADLKDFAVRDLRGIKLSYLQKRNLLLKRGADLVVDLGDLLGIQPYYNRYKNKHQLAKGVY